jgi:RimJ/RimL family protein N-acetyltransferase
VDLIGERVRLRGLRAEDAAPMARLLADPEVTRGLADWARIPYSEQDAAEFIALRSGDIRWAIEAADDDVLIGCTGLHAIDARNRHCSWGIWIGPPDRWGRGYGTEACQLCVRYAFWELGLAKVCLAVYQGNDRARRTYEKAGFGVEGVRRRQLWREGRWLDETLMAVFADHPLYTPPAAST